VSEIVGELNHLVVLFGRKIVEIVVSGVYSFAVVVDLVVEVGSSRFAGIAHECDHIGAFDFLPHST